MKSKVDGRVAFVIIAITVVLMFLWGRRFLTEEVTAIGVNRDGTPMTKEQGEALGRAMSGGHSDAGKGGSVSAAKQEADKNPAKPAEKAAPPAEATKR
jgi:hypothetical protein